MDIIIINYKSTDLLENCLFSIYSSSNGTSVNVFVFDNNSQDGVERVTDVFPQVHLQINSENIGFAKAVNRVIRQCSSPYILLLNPDTVLSPNFILHSLDYLNDNRDVGIIGPQILNKDATIQGSARRFPSPLTALFGRGTILTRLFPNNSITRANILSSACDKATPLQVDWVSGACMVIRRMVLDEVGCLDERFFMYWEDADICKRLANSGWKVVYFPCVSVIHYVGGSSIKRIFRSVFEFHRSSYLLFSKYVHGFYLLLKPVAIAGLSIRLFMLWAFYLLKLFTTNS